MTCRRLAPVLAALLTLAGVVPSAQASFPAGVWALVEKVTLEPDARATGPGQPSLVTLAMLAGLGLLRRHRPT